MSNSGFIARADVTAKLKPLRPKLSRKITAPLKVEPRSNRYGMVGTAFDYLLRVELQRRAPHAVVYPLIAERVPDLIWKGTATSGGGHFVLNWLDIEADPQGYSRAAVKVAHRVREFVEMAKTAIAAYVKLTIANRAAQAHLAAHSIRLAKLDPVLRGGNLDPRFEAAGPEDVEDLLSLLTIVPFDLLLHETTLLLNPTFGESSRLVGGADADLITGDMLVDFKTTKKNEMKPDYLDQLFGYYLLARHQHRIDPTFPEIKRLALYFTRHGYLWPVDVATWTDHPQFAEVEEWFFKRAKEVFGNPAALPTST